MHSAAPAAVLFRQVLAPGSEVRFLGELCYCVILAAGRNRS